MFLTLSIIYQLNPPKNRSIKTFLLFIVCFAQKFGAFFSSSFAAPLHHRHKISVKDFCISDNTSHERITPPKKYSRFSFYNTDLLHTLVLSISISPSHFFFFLFFQFSVSQKFRLSWISCVCRDDVLEVLLRKDFSCRTF